MPQLPTGTWAVQQLAEFMSYVSGFSDPDVAAERGVERVAEVVEAEVACIFRAGVAPIGVGFPAGRTRELAAMLADVAADHVELPGLGYCPVIRKPLDETRIEWLLVARADGEFTSEDRDLVRGMARVLGLTREMLARRRLLERVSEIQHRIVRRDAIEQLVELIVRGAAELTRSEIAVLRQADQGPDGPYTLSGWVGLGPEALEALRESPGRGVSRLAQRENRLIVVEDYQSRPTAHPTIKAEGITTMVGAPVSEGDVVLGALIVATRAEGRRYSESELAALRIFAEHASMALADARLVADAVHRSLHDALTGLPNRALFSERLAAAMARTDTAEDDVAVLFLDLDRFKTINDSLGHTAGDELLVAVARRLEGCIRRQDTAARFGGDEFAVLIEDAGEQGGHLAAQRILAEFKRPFRVADRDLSLSASIGIAVGRHRSDDPLRDGDLAMYSAKAAGRGRASVFDPAMQARANNRLELETQLRGAAGRGELLLEYQPIVELGSRRIAMVEALVRWQHPDRGRLTPDAFLALAEDTGDIAEIGSWVLRSACRQAARWRALAREHPVRVSVNLSAVQLRDPELVSGIEAALAETGLPAEALVLELTETSLMNDLHGATETLHELCDLGVALAIDDFGTGYCSLQYLQQFPIEFLKIARPFVTAVGDSDRDLRLVRAITGLGTSCGIRVIAKGVENAEQLSVVIDAGCEFGQGFLLGRPQRAETLERLLPPASSVSPG